MFCVSFGSATGKVLNPSIHGASIVEEEIKKYTTLSYRAPEMVDMYCGKAITTKADIWVRKSFNKNIYHEKEIKHYTCLYVWFYRHWDVYCTSFVSSYYPLVRAHLPYNLEILLFQIIQGLYYIIIYVYIQLVSILMLLKCVILLFRYSRALHCLIRYMLEPDPDLRPDIYQVSAIAFQIQGRDCPVQNLHVS